VRSPWFRCDARIGEDPRIAKLPSDSARWAWVVALGKAKGQRPQGTFGSQEHLEAALGRLGRHVPQLIAVGLLHIEQGGAISIRAWSEWQSDLDYSTPRVSKLRALKRSGTA
jgi:hypothetical protein